MRKLMALFAASATFVLAACGGQEDPGRGGDAPGGSAASPSPPKPKLCPLTGETAPAGLDLDRPALSVKIENAASARPQSGLENADIVYEQLAEGGITRFNAIFHCEDAAQLGPVRSARSVDPIVLMEYSNDEPVLFAYAGAAPPVEQKVKSTPGIVSLAHGGHGEAYRREKSRRAPHNLFSSTQRLRSLEDAKSVRGAPQTAFEFEAPGASPAATQPPAPTAGPSPAGAAAPAAPGTGAGNEISFSFAGGTGSRYTFDAGSGTYLRFHGAQPHNSAAAGQLRAANVVVLKVQVRPGTIRDAAGNLSPETSVTGSGEAVVLSGGKSVSGRWSRPGLSDKTTVTNSSGEKIKLRPGSIWIHLVPAAQPLTVK